jgi:hypothetical protein
VVSIKISASSGNAMQVLDVWHYNLDEQKASGYKHYSGCFFLIAQKQNSPR